MRRSSKLNLLRRHPLAMAALLTLCTGPARPATDSWVGANGSFWDLASNWSAGLPGSSDDALLGVFDTEVRSSTFSVRSFAGTGRLRVSGGTLRAATASSTGALEVTGGVLSGPGTVSTGTLSWTGGTMGEGVVNQFGGSTAASGLATISGAGTKALTFGRVLELNGGGSWAGGGINLSNATAVGGQAVDAATINLAAGTGFADSGGHTLSGGVFNNAGHYTKTGANTTTLATQFNNGGTVAVNAGTLTLSAGGSHTGSYSTAAGTTLGFAGGTHSFSNTVFSNAGTLAFNGATATLGGTVALPGTTHISAGIVTGAADGSLSAQTLTVSAGTVRLRSDTPIATLNFSGGVISGSSTQTVGTLNWSGGRFGENTVADVGGRVLVNGLSTFSGANDNQLYYGRSLDLNGGGSWSGAGGIAMTDASILAGQVVPAAAINLPSGQSFADAGGHTMSGGVFNNAGSYVKTGANTSTVASQFNHTGAVTVNAGTLAFTGGGTYSGSFSTAGGTTLSFGADIHNLNGTVFSNAGTLAFNGATVNLDGSIALPGTTQISAGLVNTLAGTSLSAQTLAVSGGTARLRSDTPIATLNFSGGVLSGTSTQTVGTLNWTGGRFGENTAADVGGRVVVSGSATLSGANTKSLYYGRSLDLDGGAQWSGAGNIALTDAYSLAGQQIPAATINLAAGRTFTDNGGGHSMSNGVFNNSGTYLKAAGNDTTTIGAAFNNRGRVQVDAGTLSFTDAAGLQGETGTLHIAAAGHATLSAGNNIVGTLQNYGTTATAIDLGTRTLTVHTDYDNAGFGIGNAFDRRANVTTSGTGNRILAAGNTNQALAGSAISGGNTATPTLTLPALRVGNNYVTYEIVNTGSTGPALRGAVQNYYSGGGITDPRLFGDGVAAGSWGPLAAGDSLTRTVALNVAQAGPQAALVGQSVRIINNFDNTLSQVLTLVSPGGWAGYNAAAALITPSPIVLASQRVGDQAWAPLTVTNTAAPGVYSEALDASFAGFTGAARGNGGSVSLLPAGQSSVGALALRLDTASAGSKSGSAVIALASDGTGTSNLATMALPSHTISISGNVYAPAVAQLNTPVVDFGIVRVGDVVAARPVSVSNGASGALTDTLGATLLGASGPFAAAGNAAAIGAGGDSGDALRVDLATGQAGIFSGSADLAYLSRNPDMADLALAGAVVTLRAQVNNLAQAALTAWAGAASLTGGANLYTLDFGTLTQGAAAGTSWLSLGNAATGPADALSGRFDLTALEPGGAFGVGGFADFAGLQAGAQIGGLTVTLDTGALGSFDRLLLLQLSSVNGQGPDLGLGALQLRLHGSVVAVPEPDTWLMMIGGMLLLARVRWRRQLP